MRIPQLYRLAGRSRLAARFWRPDILTVRFAGAGGRRTKWDIHRGRTVGVLGMTRPADGPAAGPMI